MPRKLTPESVYQRFLRDAVLLSKEQRRVVGSMILNNLELACVLFPELDVDEWRLDCEGIRAKAKRNKGKRERNTRIIYARVVKNTKIVSIARSEGMTENAVKKVLYRWKVDRVPN
jgi:hypothetical protein